MKRYSWLICLALLAMFSSCKKDSGKPSSFTTPSSDAPDALVGKWLHGNFAMASFWGYDGSYQGNPFEQSVAFNFSKDGQYEFYYIGRAQSYNCSTDALTYQKGTVVFNNNNSFTVYPVDGTYKGFYSCTPNSNFNRKATNAELKSTTYYYGFETMNNKNYLVVRFDPPDQTGSYFQASSW